ncbi:cytochrome P450 [Mycena rebaudengoi]|nr:cytochrome P450 [Mycena rebaudengoi]
MASQLLASIGACTIVVSAFIWLRRSTASRILGTLPGPRSPSWVYGNMLQLLCADSYGDYEFRWQQQYGAVYRVKGCFGEDRLVISDPEALRNIINSPSFGYPPARWKIGNVTMTSDNVACVVGEEHRRIRADMGPGFSGQGVRNFLPIFLDVANKMANEWEILCSPGSSIRLDVAKMMNHGTLDIICTAALGFPVDSVQNPDHPLARTHLDILGAAFVRARAGIVAEFLTTYTPEFMLRLSLHLPIGPTRALLTFKTTTDQIMEQKTQEYKMNQSETNDLLSTMFAASSKTGVTVAQVVHQIPLLLVAGQDTSANVLSWALLELARHPDFQHSLRQEILAHKRKGVEVEYNDMPLLNALLKETLRLTPAGPILERIATEDCVLPLSTAIKTSSGTHIRELPIRKGQIIFLALAAYQRQEPLWGSDAHEFKPSRWLEGDPCTGPALGPYAKLLSFLGGPRVCPGWRFALLEMQVILTELLAKFSVSLPENNIIRARLSTVQFPVDNKGAKGLHLVVGRLAN